MKNIRSFRESGAYLQSNQVGGNPSSDSRRTKKLSYDKWTTDWLLRRLSIYWGRLTIIGHAVKETNKELISMLLFLCTW